MRTLTAVPPDASTDAPSAEVKNEAWTRVERGYREALAVPGIPEDDRGLFLRQLRRVQRLQGEIALELVIGGAATVTTGPDELAGGDA
jgi:hypothetical protein